MAYRELSHDEALANVLAVFPDTTVIQPCPVCGGSCIEHYILTSCRTRRSRSRPRLMRSKQNGNAKPKTRNTSGSFGSRGLICAARSTADVEPSSTPSAR